MPILSQSQNDYLYLNSSFNNNIQKVLDGSDSFHSSIKPYFRKEVDDHINELNLITNSWLGQKIKNKKLRKSLFIDHVLQVNSSDFKLYIDPLFNFEFGRDLSNNLATYVNTRGIQIGGQIGKKISFYTNFYENQAKFPDYLSGFIEESGVIPGQGFRRMLNSSYDYSKSSGYVSYSPSKYFNFQFGTGKNFIGNGYRSLLLSDNSFNYPFLKITTTFWKIKYINLFTEFTDLQTTQIENKRFNKKFASIHYLSWNATNRLSIGLFESVVFASSDEDGRRGFEMNYLNPIIFLRPVEFSIGSPDNVIVGFNFSYKLKLNSLLYGQLIFDEFRLKEITSGSGFWHNKFGYQLGIKLYDFLKINNLFAQFEYNRVRPYTYSHLSGLQNYGHYNQALAHPFGANFWESLAIIRYNRNRLYFNYKFIYAKLGKDPIGENYGGNIYLSYETRFQDFNNVVAQGLTTTLIYNNIEISYLINPSYNLNATIGFTNRTSTNSLEKHNTNYIYFGFRTSIDNFYYDF